MPKLAAPERSVFSASEPEWAEAVRREAVIRPLSASGRLGRGAIKAAAITLGLSEPRVYALLRRFHDRPVAASLLPRRPGPVKGARFLPAPLEAQIEAAIDQVFLRPERPTVARVSTGGVLLQHRLAACSAELVELRIGSLVLGGDPGIADQSADRAISAGFRRHLVQTSSVRPFLQTNKTCANGRLQRWPGREIPDVAVG